jgi:signal transduction histidine kinase/ligand-binding sensor domain-containing protein
MLRKLFTCIGIFIAFLSVAQSNQPDILFERLPIPGLIQSSQINDMVQDQHGLLWIAAAGLFRYDGYTFTHYKEISATQSLGGKEIIALWSDIQKKKLYLGTHTYGLVEYDYTTDTFKIIPTANGTPIISLITQTTDGTLWCGSFSNGLYYVENDSLKKLPDPQNLFNNPTDVMAVGNKIYVDKLTKIYVLKNKVVLDTITLEFPNFQFPHYTRVTAMHLNPNGNIWFGTERAGVLVYDTLAKSFVNYFSPDKAPFYHRINKITTVNNGNIWILTKANGLVVYNPQTETFQHLTKNPISERSLSGNNCTAIVQDKTGIIWIGATGDLNKYDPAKIKFRHIYNNPFSPVSLNDNMVRGIYEDQFEKLWIGTDGGVVHIFDRKNNTMEKYSVIVAGINQHIVPMCFLDWDENIMLVGTSIGLLQYDRRNKKFSYFGLLEHLLVKNRLIRQMIKHNNKLYFTHTGATFIYDIQTKALKSYSKFGDGINSTAIYIDSKNRLWIGAQNGLSIYHPETETFTTYQFEKNINRPAGTYFMVLSIFEHNNKLWVSTFNSGLWSLDLNSLDNPVIKHFTVESGLPDNTIYSALPDGADNLWISTNQGIAKYDSKTNQFLNFSVSDGLQHEEFNRLAFVKCKNGEMVFGGINGINIFNPEQITVSEEDYTPKFLRLTALTSNNKSITYSTLFSNSSIGFDANQKNITAQFYIPNYRSPKRFEVYYKLNNYNPGWIKAETNTLYYHNLPPGSYHLEIKTISSNGIEKIASLSFYIRHHFWQTWWFILLMMVLVITIIYSVIRLNVIKAKRDKEQLEKLLRLRTQEIERSREELENLNQKKDVIFSILSHDLRSPLTTLKGFLSILIENSEYLSKEELKRHATNIRNSVTSSLDLIDNTLFWSLSQTGNIIYTPTNFSLNAMLKKVSNLYELTIEKKQIIFSIHCKEEIGVYADENMIYVALRNLVSNAIKFTSEGKTITINASVEENQVAIRVKDEGIGMSEAYLKKLLKEEHLQVKMGTSNEKGTGLGIVLCKRFIALNNGELIINSVEGKGSEFILTLPQAQEAEVK